MAEDEGGTAILDHSCIIEWHCIVQAKRNGKKFKGEPTPHRLDRVLVKFLVPNGIYRTDDPAAFTRHQAYRLVEGVGETSGVAMYCWCDDDHPEGVLFDMSEVRDVHDAGKRARDEERRIQKAEDLKTSSTISG